MSYLVDYLDDNENELPGRLFRWQTKFQVLPFLQPITPLEYYNKDLFLLIKRASFWQKFNMS